MFSILAIPKTAAITYSDANLTVIIQVVVAVQKTASVDLFDFQQQFLIILVVVTTATKNQVFVVRGSKLMQHDWMANQKVATIKSLFIRIKTKNPNQGLSKS